MVRARSFRNNPGFNPQHCRLAARRRQLPSGVESPPFQEVSVSLIVGSEETAPPERWYPTYQSSQSIRGWWPSLRPGRAARRGAFWGTLAAVASSVIVDAVYQPSGFGFEFDLAFSVALAVVVGGLVALAISLVLLATRQLPLFGTGLLLASSAVITAISFPL